MKNTSVTISEELLEWLETQVKEGRFASVSHGIRVALDKLMKKEI